MDLESIKKFTREANPPAEVLRKIEAPDWFDDGIRDLIRAGKLKIREGMIGGDSCRVVENPETGEIVCYENLTKIRSFVEEKKKNAERIRPRRAPGEFGEGDARRNEDILQEKDSPDTGGNA